MTLGGADLEELNDLYERGQYLTIHRRTRSLGPPESWEGPDAMAFAGKLAANLGAPRLAFAINRRAWRRYPSHPEVCYYAAWAAARRRGPLAALRFLDRLRDLPGRTDQLQANFLAQRAHCLAMLRDFENADRAIREALAMAPQQPWLWVEQASVLDMEDRGEQSLEAARKALALQPFYRPAVQHAGHTLLQLNRDDEAMELFQRAMEVLESGAVLCQLACLQIELGHYREARQSLARLDGYFPLLHRDKDMIKWIDSRRSDAAYYCGDIEEAARLARGVDHPFCKSLAENLEKNGATGRRVELNVGFVRQHHATCSPATLSALCRYWNRPYDHLEVAEKICYDGTPEHSERNWVTEHGFHAREFRVTWEGAKALIDAGIPFTLTTVAPGAAHLQAVFGYDSRRGVLLVRDPNERHFTECLAEEMIKHLTSTGPRGMAFVPAEEAARLNALPLPDSELYDHNYAMHRALDRHDREAAETAQRRMAEIDQGHRLTIHARATLASYDADHVGLLRAVERLLELFPDDVNQWMARLRLLRENGTRDERLKLLKEVCAKADVDPVFFQQYAEELLDDQREHEHAACLLRRAMRARPLDANNLRLMASMFWAQQDREESLRLLRFAACLEDKNEARSYAYFSASRHLNRTEEVLDYLRDRFTRFGAQKSWPAQTLSVAHEQLEQAEEAFRVIEAALEMRPDDGELLLFAAELYGRFARDERARELLERARGRCHPLAWLRVMAYRALHRNELRKALDYGRTLLQSDPFHREMNELVAGVLRDLQGPEAAEAHLRSLVDRFPRHYTLRQQLIESLVGDEPAKRETEVRKFLEFHPDDPWARRELALVLCDQRRFDEAAREADTACQLDPASPAGYFIRSLVHEGLGDSHGARDCCRQAIRLSVDYEPAIHRLVELCHTKAERQEALKVVYDELVRQVIFGDTLQTFRGVAAYTLEPERLLEILREAWDARPDLWQTWSALVHQLIDLEQHEEALAAARTAVERFPLLPRTWLDLALACRAGGDHDGETGALEKALSVNPNWGEALRQLSDAQRRAGDVDAARATLQRAIAREPLNVTHQGELADLLWSAGRRDEAIAALQQAVERQPNYEWGWRKLREWSQTVRRPELVVDLARQITRLRPERPDSWLLLAETLEGFPEHFEECLKAVDRAIELNPRCVDAHGLRSDLLALAGRFDEAVAACRPDVWADQRPALLRVKEADTELRRGNGQRAAELLEEIVRDDPEYALAWSRLADWYERAADHQRYLEAAKHLARISPRHPAAWGYLADGLLRTGDRSGAKEHFHKALELDPAYVFAGIQLFQLQIEDRQFDEALATSRIIGPHVPDDYRLAGEIRAYSGKRDRDTTRELLRRLCQCSMESPEPLQQAVEAMRKSGIKQEAGEVLGEALVDPRSSPQVAAVWLTEAAQDGQLALVKRALKRLADRGPLWHVLCQSYVEHVAAARHPGRLHWTVRKHRRRIEQDTRTWAAVGQAYRDLNQDRRVLAWMGDWRSREDAEAHMLLPLVIACMALKRERLAVEVGARALAKPIDYSTPYHLIWLAACGVMLGDLRAAQESFSRINPSGFPDYYQQLYGLLKATLEILAADPDSRDWQAARNRLRDARDQIHPEARRDPIIRRLFCRCKLLIARHHGRTLAALTARLQAVFQG